MGELPITFKTMEKPPPYNTDFSNPPPQYSQMYPSLAQSNQAPLPGYASPVAPPGTGYGYSAPPAPGQGYGAPMTTSVLYNSSSSFGKDPVTTVCKNCGANITTSTTTETGLVAWISAGVLCGVGLWCCFWIPLTMNSLKDVTHKCPNCNVVVGKHKGK